MYKRYRRLSLRDQVIVTVLVLLVAWLLLQIVIGLVRALIPIVVLAVIIVGLLWLFDRVRD